MPWHRGEQDLDKHFIYLPTHWACYKQRFDSGYGILNSGAVNIFGKYASEAEKLRAKFDRYRKQARVGSGGQNFLRLDSRQSEESAFHDCGQLIEGRNSDSGSTE
jgi:hypothetical protein